ncbi:MAG: 4'-phosphopantetheinyl transferase superfamily protein [Rhodobacteraceae bacterium]|nr:4'-phosphopantetheinyl transferase superfamily protein [Paracoccaceae bacterium]
MPHGYAQARSLFDDCITVAATDPRAAHNRTLAQESGPMARMAPVRQKAYAAGRAAAHRAMRELGHPRAPVLMAPDRAPLWPKGLTGSISHSQTCCIAALGRLDQVAALGVDVEEDSNLDSDLLPIVCTVDERAWLSAQSKTQAGVLAKLIFSAKECTYKCQYPRSKTLFGFDTLCVTPDPESGQFEATFLSDVPHFPAGTRLHGRFAMGRGLIVTAMTIRP